MLAFSESNTMKHRSAARAKEWRVKKNKTTQEVSTPLKLCYWNCNGLSCVLKQQQIAEVMDEEQIDVMMVDETHFRFGSNNDLSVFGPWTQYYRERNYGEKNGGGKMVLVSDRINHSTWSPENTAPWVENERTWIIIHNQSFRLAICSVYMAAEVIGGMTYKDWNRELYGCIGNEIHSLEQDGYGCILIGDFNAHVGAAPDGVSGNRPGVNTNGRLLLDFANEHGLIMLNKDRDLCEGLFSRITPVSSTLLDYVLVTEAVRPGVLRMCVDDDVELLAGSDHVALRLDINMLDVEPVPKVFTNNHIHLPKDRDKSIAVSLMDSLLKEIRWEECTTQEKLVNLQDILIRANQEAYPQVIARQRKVRRVPRSIKKLNARKKEADRKMRRLALQRSRKLRDNETWSENEQARLDEAMTGYQKMVEEIKKRSGLIKLDRRAWKRAQMDINNRQFWSLYERTQKKKGKLSALKDADGNLLTDILKIEDYALNHLAMQFCGMRSPIFESRGEQVVKQIIVSENSNYQQWIPKEREETEYESVVCEPTTVAEVTEIIKSHKSDRAPGVDGVHSEMLKHASAEFIQEFTNVLNEILESGEVPPALLTGKLTLIDKKKPSLLVGEKRPLTVPTVFLSVLTKLVHKRMDPICEEEGFYGSVQYGFRSGRSTTDCVFAILAVIREARRQHRSISIAFCDLAKAYDSICRELLYTKLSRIGFGGRVLSLIRSMYFNDNVQLTLTTRLSAPLWFTKGVKQGCSLSPMLFALYVAGLGNALHNSKLGYQLGGVVLTALFFADDLVLIAGSPKWAMDRLLEIVAQFCKDMHMKLAVSKTFILTNSPSVVDWSVEDETIEEVLAAKYLGVNLQIRGRNMVGQYEAVMIRRAVGCAMSIMNLTRAGLDRALIAKRLWESCAIPSILYCAEVLVISKKTVEELDRVQNMVGRFILQVPSSTSRTLAWMDAGLVPMLDRIETKQANYIWTAVKNRTNQTIHQILRFLLTRPEDPWVKVWMSIQRDVGILTNFNTRKELNQALIDRSISHVMAVKAEHTTMTVVPQPKNWFKLQSHVTDSFASRTLCCVRAGNTLLGNRFKNRYGQRYDTCPHCRIVRHTRSVLRESHVIFNCPCVSRQRRSLGLTQYKLNALKRGPCTAQSVLRLYLGGDGADGVQLLDRGKRMAIILEAWLVKVHE